MKLQNAFITERNAIGNYSVIGYEMASTTNFNYDEAATNKNWTEGTTTLSTTAVTGWQAVAKVALNDCDLGSTWALQLAKDSNGSGAAYNGGIKDGTGSVTFGTYDIACASLTGAFKTVADNN